MVQIYLGLGKAQTSEIKESLGARGTIGHIFCICLLQVKMLLLVTHLFFVSHYPHGTSTMSSA